MSSSYRYRINGLLKTDSTVLQNLEKLCNAAGAWLTYDIYSGLWSVVINRAGASEWSFDDNNIIGGINISGTGLDALYNSVKVTYPHEDLRGNTDYIQITIPQEDRYPNEPDNTLQIQYDIVTNPVQAELLGFIELKQSRVDKIIEFSTDYSKIGVKAGDIIDVTSSIYGFNNKLFRVVSVNESEGSDGGIQVDITALEYDADVYSEDLSRYIRTTENGILAIGAIPAPDAPSITKYEQDVRPRVEISTQIVGGVVERVEFWYTLDTTEPNDELRNYQLLAIQTPTNSASFNTEDIITAETDGLNSGDFFVKARAVNSQATSPFSDTSALIEYIPVQTTQNIDDGTNMTGLLGTLGLTTLLNLLAGSFTGNTSNNSLYNSVFGNYANNTGFNLRNNSGNLSQLSGNTQQLNRVSSVSNTINFTASSGTYTNASVPASSDNSTDYKEIYTTSTFTVPYAGVYKLDVIVDQNNSGANGGRGTYWSEADDTIRVAMSLAPSGGAAIINEGSGGTGTQFWNDYAMTGQAYLSTGVNYYIQFQAVNYTESAPGTASFTVGWNLYRTGD